MEKCRICEKNIQIGEQYVLIDANNTGKGIVCPVCNNHVLIEYLRAHAPKEAPKPTLWVRIVQELVACKGSPEEGFDVSCVDKIIAMVREHDANLGKTAAENWKKRAEKAESKLASFVSQMKAIWG